MTASEDVKTLFRRFGGEPESYQEVGKERAVGQALGKWAMLGQVDIHHPQTVSSVRRAVKTADTRPLSEGASPVPPAVVTPNVPPAAVAAVVPESAVTVVEALQPASAVVVQHTAARAQPLGTQASKPSTSAPTSPTASQATAQNGLSPLAARFRAQAAAPEPAAETDGVPSHTLTGLFGRLSTPASPAPQPGVLRRKFNK